MGINCPSTIFNVDVRIGDAYYVESPLWTKNFFLNIAFKKCFIQFCT